jgi:DNA-binding NarL/FixJ family response regulator
MGEISVVRILVADDSPAIRSCLRGLLDHRGDWLVCDEASNGKGSSRAVPGGEADLIVIDFQMPEMNGLDAARHIAELSPKNPILMVTIHLSKQLSEEARKVGIRGALRKVEHPLRSRCGGCFASRGNLLPQLNFSRQPKHRQLSLIPGAAWLLK